MNGFTHYSLFDIRTGCRTIMDFEPLPAGGLSEVLADLHAKVAEDCPNNCLSITNGTLHPNGEQVSFGVGRNRVEHYSLILMTKAMVRNHAFELASEGNRDSAALATAAIK